MSVERNVLVVDSGNTSIKYTAFKGDDIVWVKQDLADIRDFNPSAIYFASVRSEKQDKELQSLLQVKFPGCPCVILESSATACGVDNAYEEPNRLGVDRWLSVIGAYHLIKHNVVVVDAGTAIKFDVVNLNGQHLGGYIAPGLAMMEAALLENTARIRYDIAEVVEGKGLPNSTARAVAEGCREMTLGFLERLYSQYADYTWLMTGGDSEFLVRSLGTSLTRQDNLVAMGAKLVGDEQIRGNK